MLSLDIPMVAVNLNGSRRLDDDLCPPILKGTPTVHVAFKAKIIKHALDDFCDNFGKYIEGKDWYYKDAVYTNLGL